MNESSWLKVEKVKDIKKVKLLYELERGEAEVIVLALEKVPRLNRDRRNCGAGKLSLVGARPNFMKMAPIHKEFEKIKRETEGKKNDDW